jgi:hypothetical protein
MPRKPRTTTATLPTPAPLTPAESRTATAIAAIVDRFPRAKPTTFQVTIIDNAINGTGHTIVNAVPGSGKSTTLEYICIGINATAPAPILILAFNKAIADAMSARMSASNVVARTLNSLGHSVLMQSRYRGARLDDGKTELIAKGLVKFDQMSRDESSKFLACLAPLQRLVSLFKSHGFGAIRPLPTWEEIWDLADKYDVELPDPKDTSAESFVDLLMDTFDACNKHDRLIDFDDQLYLPILHRMMFPSYYKYVLIDESQDLNAIQIEMVRKLTARDGRAIFVGDTYQCQPAGTMVDMMGGSQKPIEEVNANDEIVSFDRRSGVMVGRRQQGRKITATSKRFYNGPLITISADDKKTQCTDNHKWITRFSNHDTNTTCVYMMQKGSRFRIGWCQLFNSQGNFHLGQRARIEKADHAWILSIHNDRGEASMTESMIAAKYGLPLITFEPPSGAKHNTKEYIDKIFSQIEGPEHTDRATLCLLDYGRNIKYPFYTDAGSYQRRGRSTIFITQACNLIPGLMMIPSHVGKREPTWKQIDEITSEQVSRFQVYSLQVEKTETYVANGLVTHNSIYGFRGADPHAMKTVRETFKTTELPLSISWRCPRAVVAEAAKINPAIMPAPNAAEGLVRRVDEAQFLAEANDGDMVLCRTTAPLIGHCLQLIRDGKKAYVKGTDIGKGLVGLLDKIAKRRGEGRPWDLIDAYENEQLIKIKDEAKADKLADRLLTLKILAEGCETIGDVKSRIASIFAENRAGVMFSTIHKAKGLEAPNVWILHPELLPHPMSRTPESKLQERNIKYVAITRAMETLTWVTPDNPRRFNREF